MPNSECFLALVLFLIARSSNGRPVIHEAWVNNDLPWTPDPWDRWLDDPFESWTFDPWDRWALKPDSWDRLTFDEEDGWTYEPDLIASRPWDRLATDRYPWDRWTNVLPKEWTIPTLPPWIFTLDPWGRRTTAQTKEWTLPPWIFTLDPWSRRTYDPTQVWTLPPWVFTFDPRTRKTTEPWTFDWGRSTSDIPSWDRWTKIDWNRFTDPETDPSFPPPTANNFNANMFYIILGVIPFFLLGLVVIVWECRGQCGNPNQALASRYAIRAPLRVRGAHINPGDTHVTTVTSIYVASGGQDGSNPALDRPPDYYTVVGGAEARNNMFPKVHTKQVPDSPPPSYEENSPLRR